MRLTVVVPTVKGRKEYLERCLSSYYAAKLPVGWDLQMVVLAGRPTCGDAWIEGAAFATDLLHLTADDLTISRDAFMYADRMLGRNLYPAPRVDTLNGASSVGEVWSPPYPTCGEHVAVSGVPLLRAEWWREYVAPYWPEGLHMYTDNLISDLLLHAGIPTVACPDYRFVHGWAQPGRGAGMQEDVRMAHDRAIYEEVLARCCS